MSMNTGYSLENIQDDVKQMMNNLRNYTLDSSDPSPVQPPSTISKRGGNLWKSIQRRESGGGKGATTLSLLEPITKM